MGYLVNKILPMMPLFFNLSDKKFSFKPKSVIRVTAERYSMLIS